MCFQFNCCFEFLFRFTHVLQLCLFLIWLKLIKMIMSYIVGLGFCICVLTHTHNEHYLFEHEIFHICDIVVQL
jgi:hypothetical protein